MKIYFDGCSWTWGSELENNEEERYSRLICNELGAEECNYAKRGGSNDRIIRNLMTENDIEKYDLAIIQMTYPARTEYLKLQQLEKDKWKKVSPDGRYAFLNPTGWTRVKKVSPKWNYNEWLYKRSQEEYSLQGAKGLMHGDEKFEYWTRADGHKKFWRYYYTNVANRQYFDVKENIQLQTIRNHCKAHNVPLILCTINTWSKLKFDYVMKVKEEARAERGHPNKLGHQIIASDLLKHYENLL